MIVSVLRNVGTSLSPIVSAMPAGTTDSLSLLEHIQALGLDAFLDSFKFWAKPQEVLLSVPWTDEDAVDATLVSNVLKYLIERGCFAKPSEDEVPTMTEVPDVFFPAISALIGKLYLTVDLSVSPWTYCISRLGLEKMTFQHSLSNPRSLAMLPDSGKPVRDMSLCELVIKARQDGWVWKKAPASKHRKGLKYELGSPLVWFSAGITIHREYLVCLLDASNLREQFAIQWIPHCAPVEVYGGLLEGMPVHDALQLVSDKSSLRKRKGQLALQQDVDVDESPGQLARKIPRPLPLLDKNASSSINENIGAMADESGVSSAGEIETALEAMMSEIEQFSNVLEPHNAGPTMPDEPQEPEDILHMQEPQSADSAPMVAAPGCSKC